MWWTDVPQATESAISDAIPAGALVAVGVYVAAIVVMIVVGAIADARARRKEAAPVASELPIELLTPRELVLMLHHLAQDGQMYGNRQACEQLAGSLKARLRELECRPVWEPVRF